MQTPPSAVHLERGRADGVAIVRIDRPHARNAIDRDTMDALEAVAATLAGDPEVRAAVLTGEGDRAFVAGGDLKDFLDLADPAAGRAMSARMQAVLDGWEALPFPTIAAVGADAFGGGCEVAMACDLRVMAQGASLVFSQARLGLMTGWGGTPRLVRAVGASRALYVLLGGEYIGAEQALALGLVHEVAPPGHALAAALDLARRITRHPPASVAALKRLVYAAADLERAPAQALENELFGTRWGSAEHRQAVQDFLARRNPRFEAPSARTAPPASERDDAPPTGRS